MLWAPGAQGKSLVELLKFRGLFKGTPVGSVGGQTHWRAQAESVGRGQTGPEGPWALPGQRSTGGTSATVDTSLQEQTCTSGVMSQVLGRGSRRFCASEEGE